MTTCVRLHEVTFAYRPVLPVLKGISLAVETGVFLAVIGPNGAGKSTLIRLLAGLLRPQSRTISLDGADIRPYGRREPAPKGALVPQGFVPPFWVSVRETVLMARTPYFSQLGFEGREDRRIVADALAMTDTATFASRPLADLSGGERQRVFIARALAQDTPILLLDEPTSFLDLKHQVAIYDLLKSVQRERGRTIIAITHDINLAAQYCDQALLLQSCPAASDTSAASRSPRPANHYRIGATSEVLRREAIEEAFGIRVFSAPVGVENVFLPLGKMAKDADRTPPRNTM